MNRVLSQTQKIIRHVADDDLVQTAGEHRAKGKLQNVDLRIEELPEGSDYQYEALFCNEGEKFLQLRWREGQVQVIRSLGKNPRGEIESTDYLAEITITTLEDRVVTEYSANGRYRVPPISRKEGSFLREYTRHTVVNGEQVNIEAVHDWYASEEDEVEGEFYAVSQLSLSENSGSFLGYDKKYVNLCSEKSVEELPLEEGSPLFLEPKNENLCFGRALGEAKEFTRRERLEEFSKLKKLSLPSVQNIRSVSFSSELTCPQ